MFYLPEAPDLLSPDDLEMPMIQKLNKEIWNELNTDDAVLKQVLLDYAKKFQERAKQEYHCALEDMKIMFFYDPSNDIKRPRIEATYKGGKFEVHVNHFKGRIG